MSENNTDFSGHNIDPTRVCRCDHRPKSFDEISIDARVQRQLDNIDELLFETREKLRLYKIIEDINRTLKDLNKSVAEINNIVERGRNIIE